MSGSSVCNLPDTGMGLSLIGFAIVLLFVGAIFWKIPRAHRIHVMLAIALPVALLAPTTQPAKAAEASCPQKETRLNWGDLDFRGPSDPSPTTSSPGEPTSYDVRVFLSSAPPVVTGDGLVGSVVLNTFTGTLDLSEASTDPPTVLIPAPADGIKGAFFTSIEGGSCLDVDGDPVVVVGPVVYEFPLTCTITDDFYLVLGEISVEVEVSDYFSSSKPQVTGDGLYGDNYGSQTYNGGLNPSKASTPPTISVSATEATGASMGSIFGGSCVDKDEISVESSGTFLFPWTCTITDGSYFSLTLSDLS